MARKAYRIVLVEPLVLISKIMNMMKKIYFVFLAAFTLGAAGCSDFLKEESQSEVIPKSTSDYGELLLGSGYPTQSGAPNFAYTSLMDDDATHFYIYDLGNYNENAYVETDDAIRNQPVYTWQGTMADVDGLGNQIATTASGTVYAGFYERIKGCNAVLQYVDTSIGTQEEKDRVKAEALAVRALYYLWLVNYYGEPYALSDPYSDTPVPSDLKLKESLGVPLKVSVDLSEKFIPRSTVAQVYDLIVSDLRQAAELMDPLPIIRGNFRINQPAIHILLSRVYLYMGEGYYDECAAEVGKALAQGSVLLDMTDNASLTPIWEGGKYYTVRYSNPEVEWLYGSSPANSAFAYQVGAGEPFQSIWEDKVNDIRYTTVFNLRPASGTNTVSITKPITSGGPSMAVRTAEAYLNRAEALALDGNGPGALADYNYLRSKRIRNYVDETLAGEALLNAIRLERRKELCYEGHRWFDLRRQGMSEITHKYKPLKASTQIDVYTLEKYDPMYTLPLPSSLFKSNEDLVQNPSFGLVRMPDATN